MSQNPMPSRPPDSAMSTGLPTVTILVPAYNSLAAVMRCLVGLTMTCDPSRTQVIATDDCSTEYNLTEQPLPPGITALRTPHNLGFAGNLNWAAQFAQGEYLLLLNQDTRSTPVGSDAPIVRELLQPAWVDAMLATFMQHEDAGIVGPRLVFPNGAVQSVGGEFGADKGPWHRYIGWQNPLDRRINTTERVSWITGAAMMFRRADFMTLGGLRGELYPGGYFEDCDACMRMRFELGKEVYYCAGATLVHEAGSTGGNPQYFGRNSATFHRIWDNKIEVENPYIAVGY